MQIGTRHYHPSLTKRDSKTDMLLMVYTRVVNGTRWWLTVRDYPDRNEIRACLPYEVAQEKGLATEDTGKFFVVHRIVYPK